MHVFFGNKKLGLNNLETKYSEMETLFLNQKHTTQIDIEPSISVSSDGYQWRKPQCMIVIRTADCLPLVAINQTKKVITNLHCGRVGLTDGILSEFLKLNNPEDDFSFFIGPHIQTYEIGYDLFKKLRNKGIGNLMVHNECYYFSLQNFTKDFIKKNFKSYEIYETNINTLDNDLYWSYRRDKETNSRNFNFAYFED